MLGDKIGSERGKVTGRRVLPGDDMRFVKLEVSFESEIEIGGVNGQNMGTYVVFERGPGQMYAEGQGIIATMDGAGIIWNGVGVGQMGEDGTIRVAAAIALQTTSENLAHLNHQLTVVEHHAHPDGNIHSDLFGWTAPPH
jgi:hypothetical protein